MIARYAHLSTFPPVFRSLTGLDLADFYDRIGSREGGPGRAAIDPRLCIALWLYATLEGVGSARALRQRP